MGTQQDGVSAGRLVLFYAQPQWEHTRAYVAHLLVFPGPRPHEVVTVGGTRELVYRGGRIELDVLEWGRPLRPARDVGKVVLGPHRDFARRGTQDRRSRSLPN